MEKLKKVNFMLLICIIVAGFFMLYCVDTISYAIQVHGYNGCIGKVSAAEAMYNNGTSECINPSRLFGK